VCFRCNEPGLFAYECSLRSPNNKRNFQNQDPFGGGNLALCELIAPLCFTQIPGQGFFLIPDRPSETNAHERVNIAVVTIVKGSVRSKQIKDKFARILSERWRWTTRKVVDNMYTMRFPQASLIKEWACFNPISMRNVKAKISIAPWNGSVGAKGELQQAWFRVRGIPYDKRSVLTLAYVGSLVGATSEVDKTTLSRSDYVRIKIIARDVSKVPASAEGSIGLYLYAFFYEREVTVGEALEANMILVQEETREEEHPSTKKLGHDIAGSSSQATTRGPKFSEERKNVGNQQQEESYISRLMKGSKSVPIGMCKRAADSGGCGLEG
jgi:hypothetical protein